MLSINASAIEQFAALHDEVLKYPIGQLCLKFCTSAPPIPRGWFDGQEARCLREQFPVAAPYRTRSSRAGAPPPAVSILSASALNAVSQLAPPSRARRGVERWMYSLKTGKIQGDDKIVQRACLPLEPRYEPVVFLHQRRDQRNRYYRFAMVPLGAKRCCCNTLSQSKLL